MPGIGGSVESITIQGRTFSVAADNDPNRKLGGSENETQANGDGTARTIKTRVPWSLSGLQVNVDDANGDQEFLQAIADGNDNVPITTTFASGDVYNASGTINSELVYSAQTSLASFDLMGPGQMRKQ